jgi:hypothetical protein
MIRNTIATSSSIFLNISLPTRHIFTRFETFTVVTTENSIFWDMPYSGVKVNWHFRGTYHLHLQQCLLPGSCSTYSLILKMEVIVPLKCWLTFTELYRVIPEHKIVQWPAAQRFMLGLLTKLQRCHHCPLLCITFQVAGENVQRGHQPSMHFNQCFSWVGTTFPQIFPCVLIFVKV